MRAIRAWVAAAMLAATPAAAAEPVAVALVGPGTNALPAHLLAAGAADGPGGGWTVVEDGTAAAYRVLAQFGGPGAAGRMKLAVLQQPGLGRGRAEVRLNVVGGADARAAGVALGLTDAGTYYAAEIDLRRGMVGLHRVQDGVVTRLAEAAATLDTGRWYRLGLSARGERLGVWLDGAEVVAATDGAAESQGHVALLTRGDSVALFDALVVEALE